MATELIAGCLGKIGEFMVKISGRQLGYLIHYNRNIENLKGQVKKLEAKKQGVQQSIDAAKNNGEIIVPEVYLWLENVGKIMDEAENFLNIDVNANKKCLCGWFPDLKSRRRLSRQAAQKEQRVTQLEKDGKFDRISNPAPPTVIEFMSSSGDFVAYDSTKLAMEEAMWALKEDKINFIGLYGMGGVGKTTLVKEIVKKAIEDHIFDKVVMVVVSQLVDLKKIQDQIAETLGSNLNELNTDAGRASRLHVVLKDVKRLLVIFDDVWERLDVKDVGVPFGVEHEGCKIMITSRRKQVCNAMGTGDQTTKIIRLDTLAPSESWDLFRKSVGSDVVENCLIKDEADKVVSECKGLPIALVTVGRAMKGKDLEGWKQAVRYLKEVMPENLEGVDQEVFSCLKLSYNYLRSEESKSCFLLCSLFPEDHNIEIELLMRYGWGLGIFKNVGTIHEARGRAHDIFKYLKESCLLLEGHNKASIKMHDVVRDVAISIGSEIKKYYVKAGVQLKEWPRVETGQHYHGISLMHHSIGNYPDAWDCPNLQILLMQSKYKYMRLEMPEVVYKGMKTLKVLDKSATSLDIWGHYAQQMSLEASFFALSNLRTLILESLCLDNITTLGEMKTLEVLSLAKSRLKDSIRRLTNLRLLDLTRCRTDDKEHPLISSDVISSLDRLEELYMMDSNCEFGDCPRINALQSRRNLTVLETKIANIKCIPEDFVFPNTIETFIISINNNRYPKPNYLGITCSGDGDNIGSHNFIKPLLRKTNHLEFKCLNGFKNALPDLLIDGDSLNVLETLGFSKCKEVEYLIDTATKSWMTQQQQGPLYELKEVTLFDLNNFKSICHGELPPGLCLSKLEMVRVCYCPILTGNLASLELLQRLQKLDQIEISDCDALENVFELEGAVFEGKKLLSNLTSIRLEELPELKHIWIGPTERINLHNLQEVYLYGCNKLKFLFEPAIARRLPRLKELEVEKCDMLEVIVAAEEQEGVGNEAAEEKMVFPKLTTLRLKDLPKLNAFSMGNFSFKWPSLERVTVSYCGALENVFELEGAVFEGKKLLSNLTSIRLEELPELKHMWIGPTERINLHNLQHVDLYGCNKLKFLFEPAIARRLPRLEYLSVSSCDMLEVIVAAEEQEGVGNEAAEEKMVFPKLSILRLYRLPNLNAFSMGNFSFEWPSLEQVTVYYCGALENVFELEGAVFEDKKLLSNLTSIDLRGLPELKHMWIGPTERINLHNLQSVFLCKCNKLKFLFEPALARRLPRLEELEVFECNMLEVIVAAEEQEGVGNEAAEEEMVFPKLTTLRLEDLPELNAFSMGNFSFEWPSLEEVIIRECPKMKTFTCDEFQTTPKLRKFKVDEKRIRELNVNMMIQKRYKKLYEESETTSRAEPIDDDPQKSETTSSD